MRETRRPRVTLQCNPTRTPGTQPDEGVDGQADADSGTQPEAGSPTVWPWTLIAFARHQYYSSTYPQIFDAQTQWIVDNKTERNILYVVHEGRHRRQRRGRPMDNASHSPAPARPQRALCLGYGQPSDYPGAGGAFSRDTTLFRQVLLRLTSLDWQPTFKGTYEPGTASNSFHLLRPRSTWLVGVLGIRPAGRRTRLADRVLKANPSTKRHRAHARLFVLDGTRFDHLTRPIRPSPHTYGWKHWPVGVNDGEEILGRS